MNWPVKIAGFAYRNWIFAWRSIFSFVEILFWPVVNLISIGFMAEFLRFEANIRNFVFTGVIASSMLQITQLDVSYSVLYDVWSKSSKHTYLAPIDHVQYLLGAWLVGMVRGTLVFVLMSLAAVFWYGFDMPPLHAILLFVSGVFLTALTVGTLVCIVITLYGQKVEVTAWSMVALLMMLSGIYYPVEYLPEPVRFVSQSIPLTYFLSYLRGFYGFESTFDYGLIKGFIGVLVYEALGILLLSGAYRRSSRTGKIINLSE